MERVPGLSSIYYMPFVLVYLLYSEIGYSIQRSRSGVERLPWFSSIYDTPFYLSVSFISWNRIQYTNEQGVVWSVCLGFLHFIIYLLFECTFYILK